MDHEQPCTTLPQLLADRASAAPRSAALLAPGRPTLRYGELAERVGRIGARMAVEGVVRGDRVAVAWPNGPDMALATLGVASHATCAPLNPALSEREFLAAFEDMRVRWLIAPAPGAEAARRAAAAARVTCIDVMAGDAMPIGAAGPSQGANQSPPGEGAGASAPPVGRPDDVAVLLRTSGTTSLPKRVPLTHAQLCRSAASIAATLHLTPADRCLNVMPLFHVHGIVAALLASLHAGASVVCTPGLDGLRLPGWLREFVPTWYTAVPAMHQTILRELARLPRDAIPACLRFVRSSSAPLPRSVAASLQATLGVPVVEAYGMTEAAHQVTSQPVAHARYDGSVGVAAGPAVAIMDATGNLLPAHAQGEVAIRGENVIAGYDDSPEINATAFAHGWFRTGDLGWLDEGGNLHLTGRIKELINRGGEKISPREVEDALCEHAGVVECAVFAVAHPTLGEDVAAAVVLAPDANVDDDVLRRSLFGRLSDAKIPSRIVVVGALPKGPTGKIERARLAAELAPELGTPFVAPRGDVEHDVAALYASVLGVERVGAADNFFVLGGDSLRAGQLLSRVQARFGVSLSLATLFKRPTPAEIATEIASAVPDAGLLPLLARVEMLTDDEAQALLRAQAGTAGR